MTDFAAQREQRTDRLGMVGKDFPDALIVYVDETGEVEALTELTVAADERGESLRATWRWLTETLTVAEAAAWLTA